jgi:hypothetical protein
MSPTGNSFLDLPLEAEYFSDIFCEFLGFSSRLFGIFWIFFALFALLIQPTCTVSSFSSRLNYFLAN